jgi:threonine/homoserine/homoserine lactone efflux protein
MNWQEFTALMVLATVMSFTPGPNTTLSAAMAANHGFRHALPFALSVAAGWGLLLALCSLGLGALLLAAPLMSLAVKLVGIAYLLYLASRLAGINRLGEANATRLNIGFVQGVALQFVNIKAWMLALAIVSGWIAGRPDAVHRLVLVLPLMMAYAFCSNALYAAVGSLLRDWLAGPEGTGRRLLAFNRAMALLLAVTAVWMLLR